ncbi:MAG: GNAT family N-acetyltransferase [Planctomycetota bacterium]
MNITIEPMLPEEIPSLSSVLGKAYLTSPMPVATLGSNLRRNEKFMSVGLELLPGQTFVAKDDGQIVGGMKMVEWPNCQLPPLKMLPKLPTMFKILGWRITKVLKWIPTWAKLDPKKPHWHFGPFGVLPERQGQGIGSQLLTYFCEQVDQLGMAAYLETDKPENVRLYQRFGFEVTSEAPVLGMPNWFMWRSPRPKE